MEETRGEINGGVNGGVNCGVNGGVNEVLKYIEQNPGVRSKILQDALQMKLRTLERHIEYLRKSDQIKFIGPPKTGGYYKIIEE